MRRNDILIFIPTYNEAGHVEPLYRRIQATGLAADVLFLDDNSSDGTGEILDGFAAESDTVSVIHRPGKLGIGSAHRMGIEAAYENGYPVLVTMDADFVHKPEDIPAFLAEAETHDTVVGTRFVRAESLAEWDPVRKMATRFGHFLTKLLLRHDFDATGAFRVYRLDRIDRRLFDLIKSNDYEFFFTSLTILHLNGYRIAEVPIDLPWRQYGTSKMAVRLMIKSVLVMMKLGAVATFRRRSLLVGNGSK